MKNLLLENIEILEHLLLIDNKIMNSNISSEEIINNIDIKLNENLESNNILIIYDGNPITTLKVINKIENQNVLLFPNTSFLGINKFLIKISNKNIYLITENNLNKYRKTQLLEKIYVIGNNEEYEEIKKEINNIIWIKEI